MLPSADQLFKDADFIFQQDLAPAHTAKSTKSWLNDHGVGVLDWPANSPDLNGTNLLSHRTKSKILHFSLQAQTMSSFIQQNPSSSTE